MIRDITIGQYYPAKSVLHRLDPRVKLTCTLLYLISLFLFKSIPGYIVATVEGSVQIYYAGHEAGNHDSFDYSYL